MCWEGEMAIGHRGRERTYYQGLWGLLLRFDSPFLEMHWFRGLSRDLSW